MMDFAMKWRLVCGMGSFAPELSRSLALQGRSRNRTQRGSACNRVYAVDSAQSMLNTNPQQKLDTRNASSP